MSILIKGLGMPNAHLVRPFYLKGNGDGTASVYEYTTGMKTGTAVPLPEKHGRLIDADAFLATIRPLCTEDAQAVCTFETVKQLMVKLISSAPTVIPKEGGAWYEVHAKRM